MSTRTRRTSSPSTSRSSVRTPRPVSIVTRSFAPGRGRGGTSRRSGRRCRTSPPSEPSALNIRIRASARSEGMIRISPSEPIPKWRSLTATASRGGSAGGRLVEGADVDVVVADPVHLGESHRSIAQSSTVVRFRRHVGRIGGGDRPIGHPITARPGATSDPMRPGETGASGGRAAAFAEARRSPYNLKCPRRSPSTECPAR